MIANGFLRSAAALMIAAGFGLAACDANPPTGAQTEAAHSHGLVLARGGNSVAHFNPELARILGDLRELAAPFHNFKKAQEAGYTLLFQNPATEPDGCIDRILSGETGDGSPADAGMGYHYTIPPDPGNTAPPLIDGQVILLQPEFLVYAPKRGPKKTPGGETRVRFAGLEYVIPFTIVPESASPPVLPEFEELAAVAETDGQPGNPFEFFPSERFGVWIFHIWIYQHNPDGLFEDFNSAVPPCDNSSF